ncbi:hypothetical protein [Edaphobacter modestus]|uniref:hypothetical protein n=1 Tax=Edaphobacter modestus TaxID=388466 RepID=UPI001F5FC80B|nr:hypothetical protein [Edaphobacter modestus]
MDERFRGQSMRRWWGRLLLAALLWSVIGLLFALPAFSSAGWNRTLLGSLAQWWSWGLITPLIFWVDERLPFKEQRLGMRILAQLIPSLLLTLVYFYVFFAVRALLGLSPWAMFTDIHMLSNAFRGGILWSWLVYWLIFGARQTYRYYQYYLASSYASSAWSAAFLRHASTRSVCSSIRTFSSMR